MVMDMTTIPRIIAALLIAATAIISPIAATTAAPANTATCMEDEPCWDCHTMGNMICGNGLALVVHPDGESDWHTDLDGIYTYTDGSMRDCSVTDDDGNRADFATECESFWELGSYIGGHN